VECELRAGCLYGRPLAPREPPPWPTASSTSIAFMAGPSCRMKKEAGDLHGRRGRRAWGSREDLRADELAAMRRIWEPVSWRRGGGGEDLPVMGRRWHVGPQMTNGIHTFTVANGIKIHPSHPSQPLQPNTKWNRPIPLQPNTKGNHLVPKNRDGAIPSHPVFQPSTC
jgi:hypothetical protein